MEEFTEEEALEIAKHVLDGSTRSYVGDARRLARYVIAHKKETVSFHGGEAMSPDQIAQLTVSIPCSVCGRKAVEIRAKGQIVGHTQAVYAACAEHAGWLNGIEELDPVEAAEMALREKGIPT